MNGFVDPRRIGWSTLASRPGRHVIARVCAHMADAVERRRGPPLIESTDGSVRLWRLEAYREAALAPSTGWTLDDGTRLDPDSPVLELHIRGDRLVTYVARGEPWWQFVTREFESIVPFLHHRPEIAIVGSTILRKQVIRFGASTRPAPASLHTRLDTFYRRLILLVFHPGAVARVLREHQPLVDAAISLPEFCRRFGESGEPERSAPLRPALKIMRSP